MQRTTRSVKESTIAVRVEGRFSGGIIVSYKDPVSNMKFSGALLPTTSQSSHSSLQSEQKRLISKECVIQLTNSLTACANPLTINSDHSYLCSSTSSANERTPREILDEWGLIENVTIPPLKNEPSYGIQSRELKKTSYKLSHKTNATVLCDRPPLPALWAIAPEELSTNSKYREAKVNARRKFNDQLYYNIPSINKGNRVRTSKRKLKSSGTKNKNHYDTVNGVLSPDVECISTQLSRLKNFSIAVPRISAVKQEMEEESCCRPAAAVNEETSSNSICLSSSTVPIQNCIKKEFTLNIHKLKASTVKRALNEPSLSRESSSPPSIKQASLPPSLEESSLPLPMKQASLPPSLRESSLPPSLRGSSLPLSLRESSLPPSLRGSSLHLSLRESSLPLSLRESSLPLSLRESPLPPSLRESSLPPSLRGTSLPSWNHISQ